MPSAEWHCTICKERIQQRESMNDNQFDDIDSQRFKELETALLNDLIEGSTAKLDGAVFCAHLCLARVPCFLIITSLLMIEVFALRPV